MRCESAGECWWSRLCATTTRARHATLGNARNGERRVGSARGSSHGCWLRGGSYIAAGVALPI